MRTQLELWQVVKDNFDEHFNDGLCILISRLYLKGIISIDEHNCINPEIESYGNKKGYFLGAPYDPKPRLEFIEKLIKKHSKKD